MIIYLNQLLNEKEKRTIPSVSHSNMGTSFAPRDPPSASSIKSTPVQNFSTYQPKYSKPYGAYNYVPGSGYSRVAGTSAIKSPVESTPEPAGVPIFAKNLSATSISSNPYLSDRYTNLRTYGAEAGMGGQEVGKVEEKEDEGKNEGSETTFQPGPNNSILPIIYTQPQ